MPDAVVSSETGSGQRPNLELFWNIPILIECTSTSVLKLAHRCEVRGFQVYLYAVKRLAEQLSFNTCPWMVFA